jgi:hypothetical protein
MVAGSGSRVRVPSVMIFCNVVPEGLIAYVPSMGHGRPVTRYTGVKDANDAAFAPSSRTSREKTGWSVGWGIRCNGHGERQAAARERFGRALKLC